MARERRSHGMTSERKPDRPGLLAPLTDARFLAALVLLIANDHVFKAQFGNWVTGKLSDLAGLVVLPVLVAVLLKAARVPRPTAIALGVVGAWFTAMKTVPAAALATERFAGWVTARPNSIVPDPTDLIGLTGLVIAAHIIRNPRPMMKSRTFKAMALGVGLLACTATSNDGGTPLDLTVDSESGLVRWVEYSEFASSDESAVSTSGPIGKDVFETQACLDARHGGDCFRIDGGRIERQTASGEWDLEWALLDHSLVFRSVGGGGGYFPTLEATDIAVSRDGRVVVAFDGVRPVIRDPAGEWSPEASSYRPIAAMVVVLVLGVGGITLAVASRRSPFIIAAVILAAIGTWATLRTEDLYSGLVEVVGVLATIVALVIGILASGDATQRGRLSKLQIGLGIGGIALGLAMLGIWKYVVSAPSGLVNLAPVAAALVALAGLAVPRPLPPPPQPAAAPTAVEVH